MRKYFVAAALAAASAQPASAITFPSLTTIYVGSGVKDTGGNDDVGIATTLMCTNVSGQIATLRFVVLSVDGAVEGSDTIAVLHGRTQTVSTRGTVVFSEVSLGTDAIAQGAVNIESTQSGVFCTAMIVDAAATIPTFSVDLRLIRVNPHPGTVE